MPTGREPFARGELLRRLGHLGAGSGALLLRFDLSWTVAFLALCASLFNWQVLPRFGGRALWRGTERERGRSTGIFAYPLAVAGLVALFHDQPWLAAAGWGLLAFGDGTASLVGRLAGGPRLPWNAAKRWTGFAAFILFGAPAAAWLWAWTARLPLELAAGHWPRTLGTALALAGACALVESLPAPLDDNVTVPLTAALLLPILVAVQPALLLADPLFPRRLALGLALNLAAALVARTARWIDLGGAVAVVAIGTVITAGLGLPGLAPMAAFFLVGVAVTRLGFRRKAERGIAQEGGGRRGLRNALANGSVPALLALLAALLPPGLRDLVVLGYAAAVAAAAADTCSSEVGKAFGRRTVLVTTLRPAPAGTEGAVSLEGTLGGLAGALAVAAAGVVGLFGWIAALLVLCAGVLGALGESVLGAWSARHGFRNDHLLNLATTALGALVAFLLAGLLGTSCAASLPGSGASPLRRMSFERLTSERPAHSFDWARRLAR